jgi:glycosyltransferase involved in cell wall biosynthesis
MPTLPLLTTDFKPQTGGVAEYLHRLIVATSREIDWLVFSTIAAHGADVEQLPYPVTRIDVARRLGKRLGDGIAPIRRCNTVRWYSRRMKTAERLVRHLAGRESVGCIAVGRWCETAHFWCRSCRKLGVPYLLFAYGMELVDNPVPSLDRRSLFNRAALGLYRSSTIPDLTEVRKRDFEFAAAVVAISQATRAAVLSLGTPPKRIFFVYPGIDAGCFDLLLEKRPANPETLVPGNRRFILAMGRLVARKGFDLAVKAFVRIADRYPDLDLVIAGEGGFRDAIETAIETAGYRDRIHLPGEVGQTEKQRLLHHCEFLIMPNRPMEDDMEGFGIVFLEAGAFGKAVIGGDNGGVPDAVTHGQTGLLVDTGLSEIPLAEAMCCLLDNPRLAAEMGRAGRERAQDRFSWESTAKAFPAIIGKLVDRKP